MSQNLQCGNEWVYGYKIVSNNTYWKNNQEIELEKIYAYQGDENANGFHFCKNLEDTLVFFRYTEDACIYQVCGGGNIIIYENDYYGVYDVYAASKLKILNEITRDQIVNYFLNFNPCFCSDRLLRFIQLFSLTSFEIELFKNKFYKQDMVIKYINYYQEDIKDTFTKKLKL